MFAIIFHVIMGWFRKRLRRQLRVEHRVDSPQTFDHGETSDNSSGVMINPSHRVSRAEHPETRDASVNTDPIDIQDNSTAIKVSERNATIDSLAQDLEREHQARVKAEDETRQLNSKLKTAQTKWKRTANKLDQVLSQSQGFSQVTDEELKQMALQLHYNIRDFAIQYFSEPLSYGKPETKLRFESYLPANFMLYLRKPDNCPKVIQAFMWNVLKAKIFDRFRWAGCVSQSFDKLWYQVILGIPKDEKTYAVRQKIHTWRATTATLVSETLTEMDFHSTQKMKNIIAREIKAVLKLIVSKESYDTEVDSIIDQAIKLDKVISSQVAMVSWKFERSPNEEHTENPPPSDMGNMVVVCPAMLKRGKSNGEDFDVEAVLLPGEEEFCAIEGVKRVERETQV
ncbi:hypothetical protein F4805DRAFT_450662 [Annulohypoxylon moriforme]|nr:hypothetical protein F4805DRAFT_450662 [Annulohypoxylon moriforme]